MAEALLDDFDFILAFDATDDFEEDINFEGRVETSEEANSTDLEPKRFEQVSFDELVDVCSRLCEENLNIPGESFVAMKVLEAIKTAPQSVSSLLESIRSAFRSFYQVKLKKKQERMIRIERNFLNRESKERADIKKKWDEMISCCKIQPDKHSNTILEHILIHFWTVRGKTSTKPVVIRTTSGGTSDESELMAIRYHGGWAVKRARDLIKASDTLVLKQSTSDNKEVIVDSQKALELIKTIGTDEKIQDQYTFVINNVTPFFVLLHDFTDNFFSVSAINEQSIIDCLKAMSVNKNLRDVWGNMCKEYPIEVQVAVLQRICSMFLKSKQQIAREKLNLKPQKGSVALRQEVKKPKGKKHAVSKQKQAISADETPAIIVKLRENLTQPETVSQCLEEIGQAFDAQKLLENLTGKQLTKLLKAFGKPSFDGKGKSKQISMLLPVIKSSSPLNIPHPDKVYIIKNADGCHLKTLSSFFCNKTFFIF